jgi:hypothetical protein
MLGGFSWRKLDQEERDRRLALIAEARGSATTITGEDGRRYVLVKLPPVRPGLHR